MKNYLNYQSTEFDCGPVSLLNGVRYLFDREEIPPDLVKFIMLYCMDAYNSKGELCKSGTSWAAMRFMAKWMNDFSQNKNFPINCTFLGLEDIVFEKGHRVYEFIKQGGVVVLHLFLEVPHYVLVTDVEEDHVLLFDPYYEEYDAPDFDQEYLVDGISFIFDQPKKANRRVSLERLNRFTTGYYEMGPYECREAVLIERTSQEAISQKD
ncbi:MAG: peptidase C39 [Lachnospiraceae bacterium]|nr:peptidase C39 [Lachnospiraceae bacterium]